MRVLGQAGRVLVVGVTLGVGVGVLRGFPSIAEAGPEEGFCAPPVAAAPRVLWIGPAAAHALSGRQDVAFVDARPREEFVAGHVSGALSAPMVDGTVPAELVALLRGSRTVIVYDDTVEDCARSTRLAELLAQDGFSDVRVLEGGMPAWLEAGYAAEAGTCRLCP